jgi:hypothetical protein
MTLPRKKTMERAFVEEAAKQLDVIWHVGPDREEPDFIVVEVGKSFGLEVTEVFAGAQGRKGSAMKIVESKSLKHTEAMRRDYEAVHNVPLGVKFVGDLYSVNSKTVVEALIAIDFPQRPMLHLERVDLDGVRIHARKGLRPIWINVMDQVGWVHRDPHQKIKDAIRSKARELPRYRASAGADMRLLIVADHFHNSGKLELESNAAFDLGGFQQVYFYSRPQSVTVLWPHRRLSDCRR